MPDSRWLIVHLQESEDHQVLTLIVYVGREEFQLDLRMIPRLDRLRSSINPRARLKLIHQDQLRSTDADFTEGLEIDGVSIAGEFLGSLSVMIDEWPPATTADGVLGMDFFSKFTEVRFESSPPRLILVDP